MEIFNVGNKKVNLYLIVSDTHRLLVDTGFPGQLNDIGRKMRKTGYKVRDIDYLIVTHFHIDHAGAIQELKNQGVKFVLFENQRAFIAPMEKMAQRKWDYTPLDLNDTIIMSIEESKEFLNTLNMHDQILSTPGHTADSISLLLGTGETCVGDLYAEHLLMDDEVSKESWKKLKQAGAKTTFPGHGFSYVV